MDAVTLERKARLLYGERWQSELARHVIGKNSRTVRLWAAGGYIPAWVAGKIEEALKERLEAIEKELTGARSKA